MTERKNKIKKMAIVFDGKKLARRREEELALAVAEFKKTHGFAPKLVSILVGRNPASVKYLAIKKAAARRVGIDFEKIELAAEAEPGKIVKLIEKKNQDPKVQGVMIQMPVPRKFSIFNFQFSINPNKDVDCLTPENLKLLAGGRPRFLPATTKAIMTVIRNTQYVIRNSKIVVVGAKGFVGEPLFDYLKGEGFDVTGVDKETKNLGEVTRQADILISATGVPNLIKKEMVKEGAVVIDVGYPRPDVDFGEVKKIASFITPVPGGIGPLTVISLLENVWLAAGKKQWDQKK